MGDMYDGAFHTIEGRMPFLFCMAFNTAYEKYRTRQINKVQFAKELQSCRPTLDKILKERMAAV